MTPFVRLAVAADLAAVAAIVAESPSAPQWSAADFGGMLAVDAAGTDASLQRTVLVACVDGTVAGVAVYTALQVVFPPETELESLAVSTCFRRRGIAFALLRAVMAAVTEDGAETLVLEVRASNTAARALYLTAGFEAVGVRRGYYAAPVEDAVLMQLVLTP